MPPGWLARAVVGVQVLVVAEKPMHARRTKMFSTPFAVFPPRFEAREAKAISSPVVEETVDVPEAGLMLGCSLMPLPGVTPSCVETKVDDGLQVDAAERHVSYI